MQSNDKKELLFGTKFMSCIFQLLQDNTIVEAKGKVKKGGDGGKVGKTERRWRKTSPHREAGRFGSQSIRTWDRRTSTGRSSHSIWWSDKIEEIKKIGRKEWWN